MSLRRASGNMYPFIDYLWSPIRGKCSHDCSYCSIKRIVTGRFKRELPPIHLDELEIMTNLYSKGEGIFIFVCDTVDMFADDIEENYIYKILSMANLYHRNQYLFQTKNSERMGKYTDRFNFPESSVLCVTIETDIDDYNHIISQALVVSERLAYCFEIKDKSKKPLWITIEPIMKFTDNFAQYLINLKPDKINIGADSGRNGLPEPSRDDVLKLIADLQSAGITVYQKKNLERLIK